MWVTPYDADCGVQKCVPTNGSPLGSGSNKASQCFLRVLLTTPHPNPSTDVSCLHFLHPQRREHISPRGEMISSLGEMLPCSRDLALGRCSRCTGSKSYASFTPCSSVSPLNLDAETGVWLNSGDSNTHVLAFQTCLHTDTESSCKHRRQNLFRLWLHRSKDLGGSLEQVEKTGPRLRLVRKLAATAAATATATTAALARERRGLYMATDQNAGTHGWDWLPILTRRLSHCKGMPLVLHLDLQDGSFQHMGSKICQKMIVT